MCLRCLVTLSQRARSTPSGWSTKRRSVSFLGFSRATRSISPSSSDSCCLISCSVGSVMPGVCRFSGSGRKKSGPGPLLNAHRTEKLGTSIARSGHRSACFFPQAVDLPQDRLCDLFLGGDRDLGLGLGPYQRRRVALALEADLGVGDVVEDDQVGALALKLAAGALDRAAFVLRRFGGEAD